jgi:ABC-type phosphate/phosphonate transport system permease subunit
MKYELDSIIVDCKVPPSTHTLLSSILFAYSYVKTNMKPAQFNQLFHRNTNVATDIFSPFFPSSL